MSQLRQPGDYLKNNRTGAAPTRVHTLRAESNQKVKRKTFSKETQLPPNYKREQFETATKRVQTYTQKIVHSPRAREQTYKNTLRSQPRATAKGN